MKTYLVFFCLSWYSIGAFGQSLEVNVSFDTLYLGNSLKITFTAENTNGDIAVDLTGLPIVSGPNTSSSISIMNGQRSATQEITYYAKPTQVGPLTIPAASIVEDGLETHPYVVLVVDNPDQIIQKAPQSARTSLWGRRSQPAPPAPPTRPRRQLKKI